MGCYYRKRVVITMPLEQLPEKDIMFIKIKYSKFLQNSCNATFDDITEEAIYIKNVYIGLRSTPEL